MKKYFLFFILINFNFGQKNNNTKLNCKVANPYSWLLKDKQKILSISKNQNIQPQKVSQINRLIKDNKIIKNGIILVPLVTIISTTAIIGVLNRPLNDTTVYRSMNITQGILISSIMGLYLFTFFYKLYYYSKDRKKFL